MKKIELLAPSGNMESLKAAVKAGCDAVYLGLTTFSARAFAGNFTHEEYLEAVCYCHIRNVKVYVTMNTLLYETEIENAIKEIAFLYENDVDAILVQDLGLFHVIKEKFPELEVHASTQMHVHNKDGALFMKKQGASRVVLARETPLTLVKEISKLGIETEVFAYGALCVSYSGQCLMSQSLKNRSGNRGMCAQMCRMKYQDGQKEDGEYLLSPKDLNVIDHIPELIESGVSSLKIEGRMKRKEYVYLVVKTFREAIDAYYRNTPYQVSRQRHEELLLMFNRGFTEGHLFDSNVIERMSHYRPNHMGIQIGSVLGYQNGKVTVKLTKPLYQHDGLRILNEPVDTGLTAGRIYKNDLLVREAHAGDIVTLDCRSKPYPKKGQPLQKTSDARLLEQVDQEILDAEKRVPITISYSFVENQKAKLCVFDDRNHAITVESDFVVQKASKAPLSEERILEQLQKVGDEPYNLVSAKGQAEHIFMPVSVLNELRREALARLSTQRARCYQNRKEKEYTFQLPKMSLPSYRLLVDKSNETVEAYASLDDKKVFEKMYPIRENTLANQVLDHRVLSDVGALNLPHKNCIAGMNLNLTNSYALAFLFSLGGIDAAILSSEVNNDQIEFLLENFLKRYGFVAPTYRLVYGKRTLMYIKDGFTINANVNEITDLHHNHFPVVRHQMVTEILENDAYRSENPYCYGSYVIFTQECDTITREILEEAYEEISERI